MIDYCSESPYEKQIYVLLQSFTSFFKKHEEIFSIEFQMRLQLKPFSSMAILTAGVGQKWKGLLCEVLSFLTWMDLVRTTISK